jgi:hypothetical protein
MDRCSEELDNHPPDGSRGRAGRDALIPLEAPDDISDEYLCRGYVEGARHGCSTELKRASLTATGAAQTQGRNIKHYASYLGERAKAYRDTKIDWVRAKETRLEKLSVEKGLLRETETVQHQLTALLKCDVRGRGTVPQASD